MKTGICKIVPPQGWNSPFAIDLENNSVLFGTRKQQIHRLQVGFLNDFLNDFFFYLSTEL